MWVGLYNICLHLAFALALPWLFLRARKTGKTDDALSERFGKIQRPWLKDLQGRRPIWIHAVSVGEAQMLSAIVPSLRERFPDSPIIVSTNTVTGQQTAGGIEGVHGTFYIPIDFGWTVRRVLSTLNPRVLIIFETEIWPNLLTQSRRRGVPVVFLNGRISERSFRGYKRIRFFLSGLLKIPHAWGMQSEVNAARIIELGAPPERVAAIGNLKYAGAAGLAKTPNPLTRDDFGLSERDLVLVGGSTFPGEEELLLEVYDDLLPDFPNLRLILAPRHPERFEEAKQTILQSAHSVRLRSGGVIPHAGGGDDHPVILLDVMGELRFVYGFADVVFMGKSMGLSEKGVGGQNPLEPAAFAKPIVCGPHMENFREIMKGLIEAGGVVQAEEKELADIVRELLSDPAKRAAIGSSAHSILAGAEGTPSRCMEIIARAMA